MKEQELPIMSSRAERGDLIRKEIASSQAKPDPRNDKLLSLTTPSFPPTLSVERNIFMAEPGNGEGPQQEPLQPIKPNVHERLGLRHSGNQAKPEHPESPIAIRDAGQASMTGAERVKTPREMWDEWEKRYLIEQNRPTLTFEERQIKDAGIDMRRPPFVAGGQGAVDDATERLEEAARSGREFQERQSRQRTAASQPQPERRTGFATWRAEGADSPINVTGYLGRGSDGKEYVSVEGSTVGVPLDEIEFSTLATEAGGAGEGGGGEPPRTATGASPEEPAPEPERDPLIGITDPLLAQFRDRVINIVRGFRGGQLNRGEYENLRREMQNIAFPPEYTQQQRSELNQQRQHLLGALAGEYRAAFPQIIDEASQSRMERKVTDLVSKIENEGQNVYQEIEDIIDLENSNDQNYGNFIELTVDNLIDRKAPSHLVEYLLEYATERILSRADINPKAQYPQFGFHEGINLDSIISISRIYDHSIGKTEGAEGTAFKYLSDLRQRRYIMHELFRSMKDRKTYASLITQNLRSEGLAFVEKEIAGVPEAKMQYEKFSGSVLGFKRGWLTGPDHEAIDKEVRDFLTSNGTSFKKDIKNAEGEVVGSRSLRPWELKRAAIVGKSLNAAMQRRLVYTVLGDVPEHDIDTLLDSVDSEELSRILAPKKLIGKRFLGIDTNTRKIFIEQLLMYTKKLARKSELLFGYAKIDRRTNTATTRGLYNKEEDSWALLDTGITDPQSNGWRGRKIFLKQKDYRTEGGGSLTIGDYLDQIKGEERGKIEEELRKRYPGKNKRQIDNIIESTDADELSPIFNNRVRDVIQRQRLLLGPLLQVGNLNAKNKQIVWENTAEFLPSRIAAFFPDETLDIVRDVYGRSGITPGTQQQQEGTESEDLLPPPVESEQLAPAPVSAEPVSKEEEMTVLARWKELRNKLFLAETKRVMDDAKALKGKAWENVGTLKDLSDYYEECGILDERDKLIISRITNFGKEKAPELARIKFPFTPFLDDVPKTDWENIEDFSYDRMFVFDHSDFQAGYGAVIGLMGKPVVEPKTVVAAFKEAVEKIQGPLGLKGANGAQGVIEKDVRAYMSMARENEWSKIFGPIMKLRRIPRSLMEEGNLQSKIAQNEDFQSKVFDGLAQEEVLSDDPAEKDKNGLTQLGRVKKEEKADAKWKLYYWARMILYLFGPIAGAEFIKVMLPREAAETVLAGF